MCAMSFREPNRSLWRGMRPGHNGIQVHGRSGATNLTLDVYEVTSGKTLYLTYMNFSSNNSAGNVSAELLWTDNGNTIQEVLAHHDFEAAGQLADSIVFLFPIELPSGHKIRIYSGAVSLDAYGVIFGWEE